MRKFFFLLFSFALSFRALAQNIVIEDSATLTRERWRDSIFRIDKSLVPTGFLYDYSMFGFDSNKWDGINNDDDTTKLSGAIFALHNILSLSKVNNNAVIDVTDSLFKKAFLDNRNTGAIPLTFIYQTYNWIRQTALSEGLFKIASDSVGILDVAGRSTSPYNTYEFFAFQPFRDTITKFNSITFTLPNELFYMKGLTSVEVDFGDGAGFRTLAKGSSVNIYYASEGTKYLTARISTTGGTRLAKSMITYRRPATYSAPAYSLSFTVNPVYTDDNQYLGGSLRTTGTIPPCGGNSFIDQLLCGLKPSAKVEVDNGCDGVFDKPIIVVEGFDPDGSLTIDELRRRFSANGFITTMRAYGYDFVYVDFNLSGTYIENNAKVLEAVINWVNQTKTGTFKSTVIGFSMGGLVARWCLKDMEDRGLPHNVANYFSYDAPQQGANIPLGTQYLFKELEIDFPYLKFFKSFRDISNANESAAARQMLVTKAVYDAKLTPTGETLDFVRSAFAQRLVAKGYPQQTRNFGIAFGRGNNANGTKSAGNGLQWGNFAPGTRILVANVTWFLANMQSKAYAVQENGISDYIAKYRFEGLTFRKIFGIPIVPIITIRVKNFKYKSFYPYDDAPGSFETTQSQFASQIYGWLNGAAKDATTEGHDGHNFVATVSALDLQNQGYSLANNWQSNNLFFNVDNQIQNAGQVNGNTLITPSLSPFRAVITSTAEVANFNWNVYHNDAIASQFATFIERNILNAQPQNCAGSNGLCSKIPTVAGPDLICTTAQYQLNNLPSGVNIKWESQNGYFTITDGQGTPTINVTKSATGNDVVKVTLTNACGASLVITKNIHLGGYSTSDYPVSGPSSATCNQYVTYTTNQLPGATNYTWFYPGNWTYVSGQGTYTITLIAKGTSGNYQVGVRVANACDAGGSYAIKNTFFSGCTGFMAFEMSPNPATNEVTIAPADNASLATADNAKSTSNSITEVNIYDQQGLKLKQYKFANQKQVRLNVSSLKLGIYFVEIVAGTYKERQQLSIVK